MQLRQARLAKGWTQKELAKAAGVSTGTIARLENNISVADEWTVKKLCKALKISYSNSILFEFQFSYAKFIKGHYNTQYICSLGQEFITVWRNIDGRPLRYSRKLFWIGSFNGFRVIEDALFKARIDTDFEALSKQTDMSKLIEVLSSIGVNWDLPIHNLVRISEDTGIRFDSNGKFENVEKL